MLNRPRLKTAATIDVITTSSRIVAAVFNRGLFMSGFVMPDESRPYRWESYLTIIFIVSVIVSPEALRPLRRAMYMPCGSDRSI